MTHLNRFVRGSSFIFYSYMLAIGMTLIGDLEGNLREVEGVHGEESMSLRKARNSMTIYDAVTGLCLDAE